MSINVDFLVYLKPDELEIEFFVRNLSPREIGAEAKLKQTILEEQNKNIKPPLKSHSQSADDECQIIKKASTTFSKFGFESAGSADILDIKIALARIVHYIDRARRVRATFGEVGDITSIFNSLNRSLKFISDILISRNKIQPEVTTPKEITPTASKVLNDTLKTSHTGTIPKLKTLTFESQISQNSPSKNMSLNGESQKQTLSSTVNLNDEVGHEEWEFSINELGNFEVDVGHIFPPANDDIGGQVENAVN